ncbi:alkyl hydroperoxide reductase subunit F [Paraperlucidibaca baekdonensis]|uniref:Alkyl hydroperoxide reductase subunit F n=1 Tax=Paraperlucidibaca baekdonensis TaxID=748120 RepID=A0A3E0H8T0_9GAMM|nr:alkyl hydroperoxide reductase subunit F [Paraperlucidibaca baekdonensis]REH40033.1 alkyl hydroperoxide reductase subunit F [Paraperlucidibaca baekdonensis]
MLDAELKTQLAAYLQRLVSPIELVASLDERAESQELLALLHDIAALNPQIAVREDGSDARRPSFAVNKPGEESGVCFAGIPLGHEFTSLVLALLQVSGYAPKVSDDVLAQIRELPAGLHFETFISLSCHNCPDVVQAFNLMAVVNPGISHTMIDGALFQDEVERKQIMSVPSVHLNGESFGQGRMTLEEILAKVDINAGARDAEKLNAKAPYDVLIVGGGPAGAAAAIYAARKGIRTGVVAERFGGQVLDTMGIENFISVSQTEGPKLVAALEQHVKDYDVDVMNTQRATALSAGKQVSITLANGAVLESKSVIIATGARWREMNVPGEQEYRGRGVAYCPHCDGPLFKGKQVGVIGGGNSGVEAAIDLAGIVAHVTLIEFDKELRADAVLQKKLRSLSNVTIITSALTTEVLGNGDKMTGLTYKNRLDDSAHELALDGVFVQIGLLPNTDWLKGSVALSPRGEIEVDAKGQTSVPGVFAAGDATTSPYKQIIIAMGEGSKAALSAFDHLIRSSVSEDEVEAA